MNFEKSMNSFEKPNYLLEIFILPTIQQFFELISKINVLDIFNTVH